MYLPLLSLTFRVLAATDEAPEEADRVLDLALDHPESKEFALDASTTTTLLAHFLQYNMPINKRDCILLALQAATS